MKSFSSITWKIFNRELRLVGKDFDIISIILLAPLLYTFLYGSFYVFKTEQKIPVAVIDSDRSHSSSELLNQISAHQTIVVIGTMTSFTDACKRLNNDQVEGVVYIPGGFSQDLKNGKSTTIKLYLNTHRFLPSNDINKAMNDIVLEYAKNNRTRIFMAKGFNPAQAELMAEPLKDDIRFLANPSSTYGDFLIPGIFILILQQTLLMGFAQSVAKENESSKFNVLYRLGKGRIFSMAAGKSLFYFAAGLSFALFFFTVEYDIFKIVMRGSLPLLMAISVVYLLVVLVFIFCIGTLFKTKKFALIVMAFTSYPVFFMSGYAWPIEAMPEVVQYISMLLPITPFFEAYTRVVQFGANTKEILPELIHLVVLFLAGTTALYFRLRSIGITTLKVKTLMPAAHE